eukprot:TRINITY_DN7921_c0_g1_i1.p1 TRINITY_DN7921_c0_g1~~TRINITY_DN7921_c0_g1_i1.p1  ORF type:complete len:262 (-),score=63.07 TRINITY_DN7921_c0_g1_i1:23-808(-)
MSGPDNKVFIGGLSWQTTPQTLQMHFAQFGDIEEVKIIMDKQTGRSKGYGFVVYTTPDAAARAVANPYPLVDGKQANCNLASLNAKPQETAVRKPRTQKRTFSGFTQTSYPYPTYPSPTAEIPWSAPTYVSDGKRRKLEQQPKLSYIQQLAQNGIIVTKESAIEKIESLKPIDPKEAFKYFLEVNEVFKGAEEYDVYYNALLEAARESRSIEAIAEMDSDDKKYYEIKSNGEFLPEDAKDPRIERNFTRVDEMERRGVLAI